MIEQFLQGLPGGLWVWLRPESLRQVVVLADSYVLDKRLEPQLKQEKLF